MTRKDYTVMAKLIRKCNHGDTIDAEAFVLRLCAIYAKDNERFNGRLFVKACGVKGK